MDPLGGLLVHGAKKAIEVQDGLKGWGGWGKRTRT